MYLVSTLIIISLVTPVFAQVEATDTTGWATAINWSNNSKRDLKKQVSKKMNEELKKYAEKWTKEFLDQPRKTAIEKVAIDLKIIAEQFHKLYAAASAAYILGKKGYFQKEEVEPFPFDPREEVDKENYLIGEFLYEEREGLRYYISQGNRGLSNYLDAPSYLVTGNRKVKGGQQIINEYAAQIVRRWENAY
ncbi:TPA: hypothetical protein DIC40_06405 [Patescibacteria group bacterium]|nr:hypothetical protein [Candidatus Gracilibacteria bacterium]